MKHRVKGCVWLHARSGKKRKKKSEKEKVKCKHVTMYISFFFFWQIFKINIFLRSILRNQLIESMTISDARILTINSNNRNESNVLQRGATGLCNGTTLICYLSWERF